MVGDILVPGDGFELTVRHAGSTSAEIVFDGCPRIAIGRVRCGKFGELGSVCEKMRIHRSGDGLRRSIETCHVIPFGCEYRIGREIVVADGLMKMVDDISAVNYGRVGDVSLEDVTFPGAPSEVSLKLLGNDGHMVFDSPSGELYSGKSLPLSVSVAWNDGARAEYDCGFDVWRHDAASSVAGAEGFFRLYADSDGVHLVRRVLVYADGVEPEKRPWRFVSMFAWMKTADSTSSAPPADESAAIPGCELSPAFRREFRRRIRRCPGSFRLEGVSCSICTDASHLERQSRKELAHGNISELMDDYLWANGELRKRGGVFTIASEDRGVALARMGLAPVRFKDVEDENG